MAVIGVTRLRVRSVRFLPAFAVHFLRTRSQVRQAPGFRGGSVLPDRHWTFWTMTAWDSQESMRRYMTTPPHRTTMPYLLDWCDEASVVHWDLPEDALPSWHEAHRRMCENGRASKVRNPSPQHATLSYPPPRVAAATILAPRRSN
jgi:heme-degrading monooxygenase HmoA